MSEHDLVHELRVLENQMRGLGDREAADSILKAHAAIANYRLWFEEVLPTLVKDVSP